MSNNEYVFNEQELIDHLAAQTKIDANAIRRVLKHEQTFIDNAKEDKNGEINIDSDELVDYILKQSDVKLDELTVETILDLEMDFLSDKGLADIAD